MSGQPYIEPVVAAPAAPTHSLIAGETPPPNPVQKVDDKHLEGGERVVPGMDSDGISVDATHTSGLAVIEQLQAIPRTGKRMTTGKWEYITFCLYCEWRSSDWRC